MVLLCATGEIGDGAAIDDGITRSYRELIDRCFSPPTMYVLSHDVPRQGNKMTTMVESSISSSSRKGIERAIAELYAAGLDLQTTGASRDVPVQMRAQMPEYIRRVAALIDDLRIAANSSSI